MLTALPVSRHFQQSVEIFTLEAHYADGINVAQFALAHDQGRVRDFHRIIRSSLAAAQSFEQPAGFLAAAAAQFGYGHRSGYTVHNLSGVAAEQALVSPR